MRFFFLRETIVNRTYDTYKALYISHVLLTFLVLNYMFPRYSTSPPPKKKTVFTRGVELFKWGRNLRKEMVHAFFLQRASPNVCSVSVAFFVSCASASTTPTVFVLVPLCSSPGCPALCLWSHGEPPVLLGSARAPTGSHCGQPQEGVFDARGGENRKRRRNC